MIFILLGFAIFLLFIAALSFALRNTDPPKDDDYVDIPGDVIDPPPPDIPDDPTPDVPDDPTPDVPDDPTPDVPDDPTPDVPDDPTPDVPDDPTPDVPDDPTPDDPEPEKALLIELTNKEGYDNTPVKVENALPGGKSENYYCITVTHEEDVTVSFSVAVDLSQKLTEVVRIKVEHLVPSAPDVVLYDGLLKDCASLDVSVTADGKTESPIYYRVTIYTNGAEVTNEYIGESLNAKLVWQLQ